MMQAIILYLISGKIEFLKSYNNVYPTIQSMHIISAVTKS